MDYADRVQTAVDYIEAHLTERINLEEVARQAAFSLYHFHRLFAAITGQSLKEYIRRRRLTEAAAALLTSRRPILDVALEYQFEAQASFSRAFLQAFGMAPGAYRRQGRRLVLLERPRITCDQLPTVQPRIVQVEPFRVVGIPYVGQNQQGELGAIARQVWAHPSCAGTVLGVCEPVERLHDDSVIHYLTGFPASDDAPAGMTCCSIPGGRYAVFTHRGSVDRMGDTYAYIWGVWLPRSGEEPAWAPDFELYDHRFCPGSPQSEVDICIPLQPV